MPTGPTTTGSLTQSLPYSIAKARQVREYEGVFMRTTDQTTLKTGEGLDWNEISIAQLNAQAITETMTLNNPQQLADTLFTITPLVAGIHIKATDRTWIRIASVVKSQAEVGSLAQKAMQRYKDEQYLALFATFTTTLGGTGTTHQSGFIAAANYRILNNTTEPGMGPVHHVHHGFCIKDIRDEIVSGVGTYVVPSGMTEDVYKRGLQGMTVDNVNIWTDGNITIDATPDARGAVHAKDAVVQVQARGLKRYERELPDFGGGGKEWFWYDEFAFGERSAGNWAYGVLNDATAPTS
jgi:hypothetical protein